jgi:hypothetical protein
MLHSSIGISTPNVKRRPPKSYSAGTSQRQKSGSSTWIDLLLSFPSLKVPNILISHIFVLLLQGNSLSTEDLRDLFTFHEQVR